MPGASAILRFPTRESMSPGEVQLAHSILPSQKVGQPLGPQVAFLRKYSRGEDPAKPGWDSGKQIHRLFFFFLLNANCQVLPPQTEFITHVFVFLLGFFQLVEPDEKGTCTHAMQEHTCVHTAQMHTQSPLGNILYDSCCNVAVQWEHSIGRVDNEFHLGWC